MISCQSLETEWSKLEHAVEEAHKPVRMTAEAQLSRRRSTASLRFISSLLNPAKHSHQPDLQEWLEEWWTFYSSNPPPPPNPKPFLSL